MSTAIPAQIEKCKGAMLATAIGDALGWPNEPRSKNRAKNLKINGHFVEWTRSSSNPCYHDEKILPGEYSDDTQMTLSVARSVIAGNWEKFLAERELPFWLRYERGGGGALLKAAKSLAAKGVLLWQSSYTRDYFNAGGNGAAMRILPHVIASAKNPDVQRLMIDVIKDTLITHGHPRAFLGATCYAYALDYLLRKETVLEYGELVSAVIDGQKIWGTLPNPELFEKWIEAANQHCGFDYVCAWDDVYANMIRQLEFIKASLKKGLMLDDTKVLTQLECFGKVNGAGDVAALAAIYLASRYASNPALGIKVPAFSFGADTDTIASITGGLLGMLSGTNWIPTEWKVVQDYDCLIQMTELLLSDNKNETNNETTNEITKDEVSETKGQYGDWINSPIGKMRPMDKRTVPNGKYAMVIITKWQTSLGQIIYMKEMQRLGNQPQFRQSEDKARLYLNKAQPVHTNAQAISPSEQTAGRAPVAEQKQQQFILMSADIAALLDNPELNKRITLVKTLQIVGNLLDSDDSTSAIAKRLDTSEATVGIINSYIKEIQH
jgi:ADP-ribosylglycohydrolase